MSYQVIARKYRPQRFSDVVGQEHVTQTLARAVEQNRIAHAYLFCGPRGTGKTTIARIFAKCLNCTGGPKVDFDNADPKCIEISESRSLDVLEIDGASNNGVEQVRELRDTCRYAPASSRFKVYIIDEVHMLTTAAFNALLKTLEEPPEHVKFMFATTEPEKVIATILSRCQRFDLRRIPAKLIVKHLSHIAKLEKVESSDAALHAIARGAEGAMRDAESTLDQLISFCCDKIEEADVLSMFGLTAQGQLLDLTRAILSGEVEQTLRQFNDLAQHGKDLGRLLADLLNHVRNLLVFQVSRGDLSLLEVTEAEAAALKEQSDLADVPALTRVMDVLTEAELRLRDAASKKILIEVALLKAIEARQAVSLDSVLKRLQDLRQESGGDVVSIPAPSPAPARGPKPFRAENVATPPSADPIAAPAATGAGIESAPASAPSPENPGPINLRDMWFQLIDAVGRAGPFLRTYLLEAHPVSFVKNVLTIGFDPQFQDHIALVDNARNHALIQTKLSELGHSNAQIRFIKAERPEEFRALQPQTQEPEPGPTPEPAASQPAVTTGSARSAAPAPAAKDKLAPIPFSKDDFKNDPLIQKALEIFKGQIVEVRA